MKIVPKIHFEKNVCFNESPGTMIICTAKHLLRFSPCSECVGETEDTERRRALDAVVWTPSGGGNARSTVIEAISVAMSAPPCCLVSVSLVAPDVTSLLITGSKSAAVNFRCERLGYE